MNLGRKERIYQGITTAPLTIINLAFLFWGTRGETQGGKGGKDTFRFVGSNSKTKISTASLSYIE